MTIFDGKKRYELSEELRRELILKLSEILNSLKISFVRSEKKTQNEEMRLKKRNCCDLIDINRIVNPNLHITTHVAVGVISFLY